MTGERRPPPRALNVQHFADARSAELESLHAVIARRVGSDFRVLRHKRRRTSSFINRRRRKSSSDSKEKEPNKRKKREREVGDIAGEDEGKTYGKARKEGKSLSRRVRRSMEFKRNPKTGFVVSGDGTKRLRTHVWHAKRFEMVKRWGFYLPLGLSGRGRGSRAILKQLKSRCLIHDASYFSALQLEGTEESILSVLDRVLVPPPSTIHQRLLQPILSGISYGHSMLYHAGADSQAIAPVTYMWRPLAQCSIDDRVDAAGSGYNNFIRGKGHRQLWIWLHAASFKEGFDSLKATCEEQMHENSASVTCFSCEGEFGMLELIGSKALQICQNVLKPVSESGSSPGCSNLRSAGIGSECLNPTLSKSFALKHAEHLPHAILSLSVIDPRMIPQTECESHLTVPPGDPLIQDDGHEENVPPCSEATISHMKEFTSTCLKHEKDCIAFSDCKELWISNTETPHPPVEESLLCNERHQRRLSLFCIDITNPETCISEDTGGFSRTCSLLLLRNMDKRWSIILPVSWVKVFWMSLVSHGGRAIGLRERKWIACDVRLPSFPYDFPDCKAYMDHAAAEAVVAEKKAATLPPSRKPLRVPMPPPWNCITTDSNVESLTHYQDAASSTGVTDAVQRDLAFQGIIVRAAGSLPRHLQDAGGDHLLLCPEVAMLKWNSSELVSNGIPRCNSSGFDGISVRGTYYFVRTILYAHKEGVFEEGAVVCAPISGDYSSWSSRSYEQERIQIPPALLRSYFSQQPTGRWELRVPEDSTVAQFHRHPIGFVTTGFVRGSTRNAAIALCEASLLSQLRKEQWEENLGKGRSDIKVLVRNPSSTAYRPALATIILEQQNEDLCFM